MSAGRTLLASAFCVASAAMAAGPESISHSIAIKDGLVARAQRVLKVPHHSSVRIEWFVDRPMTVHLEGYDLSVTPTAEKSALMQFKAFATGRFAVHAHEGERRGVASTHAHGRGAVLWLEVHPK